MPNTYTTTYLDGQLKLYAHHVTKPTTLTRLPGYLITQLTSAHRAMPVLSKTGHRNPPLNTQLEEAGFGYASDLTWTFPRQVTPIPVLRSTLFSSLSLLLVSFRLLLDQVKG